LKSTPSISVGAWFKAVRFQHTAACDHQLAFVSSSLVRRVLSQRPLLAETAIDSLAKILFAGLITIANTWERPADVPEEGATIWLRGHARKLRAQP
jgi:hypothetical protein